MIRASFGLERDPFRRDELTLLPHQQDVFEILRVHCHQGGFCVVIGEPGTGKSVLKDALVRLDKTRLHVPVVSEHGMWAAGGSPATCVEDCDGSATCIEACSGVVLYSEFGTSWSVERRDGRGFRALCMTADYVLATGDSGLALIRTPDGTWTDHSFGSNGLVACTSLADGTWLVGDSSGGVYRLGAEATLLDSYTPPITQIVRDGDTTIVVADESVYSLTSDGRCPSPCEPLSVPGSSNIRAVAMQDGIVRWYLRTGAVTLADGGPDLFRSAFASSPFGRGLIVVGSNASIFQVNAP